ncbi:MAG: deoxyribose-phosphate aldolase [Bacteroidetes bacterium GWF2_43_63]|nr:MAG: deoxyribose-phosphate aldolase [Bacteroidetes bacterium GWE2_42_42]OFY52915.1 MAG: deoxyribose-phosphate aldolase [Bacteroidetes bacterium GWF2_43_63]HBG70122.1 deoxyribose-phosphate aldolase [Bacteroidales bacterium]HCB62271.1 deoxyribose-phosphate aldolase [Bacteroidales bacterium]
MAETRMKTMPLVKFPEDEMLELVKSFTPSKLASFLDVTDLKADTLGPKMEKMAEWAISLKCASVCVNPVEVDVLPTLLKGSGVNETYVMDFPLGKMEIDVKACMTADTVKKSRELRGEGKGHIDIDIVINVGRFKKDPAYTLEEINAMCDAADGELVKVIVRSSELTETEVYKISELVLKSKAQFIKNSTGMDPYGATPEHIRIMREVVGDSFGVKAAGGISDAMTALRLLYAGAKKPELQNPSLFRIGTSAPLFIFSSMGYLRYSSEEWLKAQVIPCTVCPYHMKDKVRREIREESNTYCQECQYKFYLKNKDF